MFLGFLIVLCAFLPNIAWLMFYLREDVHPEPKPLLAAAFVLGVVCVGIVYLVQRGAVLLLSRALDAPFNIIVGSYAFIICAAVIEEIIKFISAKLLLRKNPVFEEPIDAMIYLVVIGLGFAFTENILYLRNFSTTAYEVINLAMVRFVSANLLHAVASGMAGYFWAQGIVGRRPGLGIFKGLLAASLIHVLYNVLALIFQNQFIVDIPIIFILVIGIFELRDFEKLRQLSTPVSLEVYTPANENH
jgi:RsiW-degrading membrane proteinase PrsW (M82 family)